MPDIKLLARLALPLQPLFARLEPSLASIYRQLSQPPAPNLWGDRDIEHSWVAAYVPDGPGEGLDFGSGDSHLSLVAARRGFRMLASDLNPVQWSFQHPSVRFVQADALALPLPPQSFDLILNCSTIEHLGLGRYGDRVDPDADLKGMSRLHDLLKPTGIMLLTTPVGIDTVYSPLHRIYGHARLPRLLGHFSVTRNEYWAKKSDNVWSLVDETTALSWQSTKYSYAIDCFALKVAA